MRIATHSGTAASPRWPHAAASLPLPSTRFLASPSMVRPGIFSGD